MINIEVYEHFAAWLDALLENNDMPEETKAFNFNIYEDRSETGEPLYTIQLIAAGAFDPEDKDGEWACEEVWSSEEDLFALDFSDEENVDEKRVVSVFSQLCSEYLEKGTHRSTLLSAEGIGIGFVDGDLELLTK
ncbi:MAG: hypothetical protein II762_00285 [Ruminococcus sp.]|nr:hypothetical protein [Ruminococcus sp.]HOO06183.1 hypothetical protein [Ruminococcus sp.]